MVAREGLEPPAAQVMSLAICQLIIPRIKTKALGWRVQRRDGIATRHQSAQAQNLKKRLIRAILSLLQTHGLGTRSLGVRMALMSLLRSSYRIALSIGTLGRTRTPNFAFVAQYFFQLYYEDIKSESGGVCQCRNCINRSQRSAQFVNRMLHFLVKL